VDRAPEQPAWESGELKKPIADRVSDIVVAKQHRGARRLSGHVPVTATLEV
jgi:hypothetical protein